MTTPVFTRTSLSDGEKMEMTTPVITKRVIFLSTNQKIKNKKPTTNKGYFLIYLLFIISVITFEVLMCLLCPFL